jgi:hypothetical protein
MDNTSSVGTISTLDYNTIANDNTKPIQEIDIKVVNNQNKQLIIAEGYFSEYGTVFSHESIILRGLTIIKENPDIGVTVEDIRKQYIKNNNTGDQYKETKFKHTLPIFQPKHMSMAVIAEHYKNKYNINIYFINTDVINSISKLVKQLKNGEKIGIIAKVSSRIWHMTPLVISKNNEEIYIVTMDSVNITDDNSWSFVFFNLIESCGTQQCHILHAGIPRQQDHYSCMNDAIIILKDALRKPNLINELLKTNKKIYVTYNASDDEENGKTCYQVGIVEFPEFLYKTVQNKESLDKLTTKDLQSPLKQKIDISSNMVHKTLQTHLNKYTRVLSVMRKTITINHGDVKKTNTEKDWQVNTYLQTKPYRMLVKSFDEIANANGKLNQETATKLVNKYVNPSFLIVD